MKTNLVKAVMALTLISAAALAAPHQFSTVELLTSGNVPDQKVSAANPGKTPTKEVLANTTEYIISTVTQPSEDETCTIEDLYTVKLILLDNSNGELRMYDADANLVGMQPVALSDDEETNESINESFAAISEDAKPHNPVNKKPIRLDQPIDSKIVSPIDAERKRIAHINGQLPDTKSVLPIEGKVRHAIDHVAYNTTEDRSGNDRVSLCLLRHRDFIAARQLQANITCKDILVKITCPEINVFTTLVLKSKCNFSKISYDRNRPLD